LHNKNRHGTPEMSFIDERLHFFERIVSLVASYGWNENVFECKHGFQPRVEQSREPYRNTPNYAA
jgi:hypothetical protein